ncbi:hypothetical protein JCM19235_1390 [Vibrio maritimus]|uniref:Uncharacterized protein n=1 Tax=Vibrio maritimus TaxID=990268 RepID=A0A090S450_9VIBR|nr:hypothetical protein JCM19235_1390 [Vibrio maritimus]
MRDTATDAEFSSLSTLGPIEDASDILVTPDAKTIYVKAGNSLAVINREPQALKVREIIDLSTPNGLKRRISNCCRVPTPCWFNTTISRYGNGLMFWPMANER